MSSLREAETGERGTGRAVLLLEVKLLCRVEKKEKKLCMATPSISHLLPGNVLAAPASALCGWKGVRLSHSLSRHAFLLLHTHVDNGHVWGYHLISQAGWNICNLLSSSCADRLRGVVPLPQGWLDQV